jgi:uncharacterized membrane-anchored protein YjiN (DUF445 family)
MITRSNQNHKPAKTVRVKRRVYEELLGELEELQKRDKLNEKIEGYLNQAIVHLARSDDPEIKEFVQDCVEEINHGSL